MQDDTEYSQDGASAAPGSGAAEVLATGGSGRRRYLLKGIGKGAALLSAVAPIQTLAGQTLLTFDGKHQCTVSGMHSGVHSTTPKSLVCGGYSPGWWGQSVDNTPPLRPKRWPALPSPYTYEAKCVVVFSNSTLRTEDGERPTLFQIVEPQQSGNRFSNTDEYHWVSAWLNAVAQSDPAYSYAKFNFPYTAAEVLAFYNAGAGSDVYTNALTFFKTYMETHAS